jgi:hypothetical protein
VSIGLIVTIIVLIAVVLTLVVRDNDDNGAADTVAPAGPPSFTNERAGDGLASGQDEAVVPALRAHTGEFQGEGRMSTAGDLSVNRPMARYEPMAGEGRLGGYIAEDTVVSDYDQARRAYDEMLFDEWNDPLGWAASPEPRVALSSDEMRFLEMNGVYDFDTRLLAAAPARPAVESFDHIRFMEWNTFLPGWTDHQAQVSDRQGLTEF